MKIFGIFFLLLWFQKYMTRFIWTYDVNVVENRMKEDQFPTKFESGTLRATEI